MITTNTLAGRDVLRLLDLSPAEVALVLDTATEQKAAWAAGDTSAPLAGRSVAIILEKPSMRTRVSFEVGCVRLGAHPVVMTGDGSAFSRGESVQDTTLVLERFCDAIVLRTFAQDKIAEVAKWASVPVVNALTDDFHPCQGLADLLTIREHKGDLKGLTLAYVGDGNNMAGTYLEAGALTGMHVRIATPVSYECAPELVSECAEVALTTGGSISVGVDPIAAVSGADIVVTDTWASMGDEDDHDARLAPFAPFQVNAALMAHADSAAIFLHCLPAHRGEEVLDEVADAPYSRIYDEAENRLHAQKALLSLLMAHPTQNGESETR